jgi:hypothetical protein
MKKLNQNGFIPMLICILLVIGSIIALAYWRVSSAGK